VRWAARLIAEPPIGLDFRLSYFDSASFPPRIAERDPDGGNYCAYAAKEKQRCSYRMRSAVGQHQDSTQSKQDCRHTK
jgi:hypothetical protein